MDVAHALRIGRQVLRNVFARERLDEAPPPPAAAPAAAHRPAWRLLFAPEELAVDPEPAPPPRRIPVFAIFTPEVLPEEPPPEPSPPRARWLRWLFVPESLEP